MFNKDKILKIQKASEKDISKTISLLKNDSDAIYFLGADTSKPLEELNELFNRFSQVYTIKLDNKIIGLRYITYSDKHEENIYTTGGFLTKKHRGKGYGTHVYNMIHKEALRLGATHLEALTGTDNEAAKRALVKAGFTFQASKTRATASGVNEAAVAYRK